MKGVFAVVVFILVMGLFTFAQSNLERAKRELQKLRDELADVNKKSDILFLLDTSRSLTPSDFHTEKEFVKNFLHTITVSMGDTRVEVIPFANTASRYIDGVSVPSLEKHKCSLVEMLKSMPQSINGFDRNTYGAFKLAFDICIGQLSGMKRGPLSLVRTVVILVTVGRWQGQSPVSIAKNLQQANIEVFVIGVGNCFLKNNLKKMVNNADKQAFYFRTFDEFAELSADLRADPFGTRSQNVDPKKCNSNCDPTASCVCHLTYATYQCLCPKGYGGSGLVGQCNACPHNTYNDGSTSSCKPCPANSGHSLTGSRSVSDCKCFKGYQGLPESGNPCTVRSCEPLLPPSNGAFIGVCNSKYNSVCRVKCNEGYEVSGSAQRMCIVTYGPNIMVWSEKPFQCQVIRCPLLFVLHADPPTGICSNPELSYHSYCSFKCRFGYRQKGSEVRVCQLDGTWSGASTTCEETRCPKLPTVRYATVTPPECATQPMRFYSSCRFDCPDGYFTEVTGPVVSTVLTCQLNGAWDAGVPRCHDRRPPTLTCPHALTAETTKGKATGKVSWKVHVTDNSVIMNPNAKINVTSSHQPLQELPIGVTRVVVTASDLAGNVASCSFRVEIKDTEPPTFSQCPGDIAREEEKIEAVVRWAEPVFSDNSGQMVSVVSNRQSGARFAVPGNYDVVYTATDRSHNVNKNCTFRITLKKKQCTPFTPPRNGALVCATKSDTCAVMCRTGTDFESNPPLLYICSSGVWQFFSPLPWPFKTGTPGPNCAVGVNHSQMKIFPYFYFDGEAPNVQDTIKDNFYLLLMSPYVPPFCKTSPHLCLKNDMSASLGVKG